MKKLLLLILVSLSILSNAQVHIDLDSGSTICSQWKLNPANSTDEKIYLILPAIGGYQLGFGHTGFTFNDVINDNQVTIGNTIDRLDKENHFLFNGSVDLFGLGFNIKNTQLRLGLVQQLDSRITYSRDFLELLWLGNGHPDLIGNRISLDHTGLNALALVKAYAGASVEVIPEKLKIGANLNFYTGLGTVQTFKSQFGLTTSDSDYTLTVDGDLDIAVAGVLDIDELESNSQRQDLSFKNTGIGADLGLVFNPSPMYEVKASILNLGKINWSTNVSNYRIDNSEITFTGFDFQDIIGINDSSEVIQQFVDSIANVFTPEQFGDSFTSNVNPEIAINLSYIPSDNNKFSVLYRSKNSFGIKVNHVGVTYARRFVKVLELSSGLVLFNTKDIVVPFNLALNAGSVQLGLQTTNVLAPFFPKRTKYVSGAISLAFVFGKKEE